MPVPPPLRTRPLWTGANCLAIVALVALCVAAAAPAIATLANSLWTADGFSLAAYREAWGDPARTTTLLAQSLISALGSVLIASGLGLGLGFLCFRTDVPGRRAIIVLSVVCACIPIYVTSGAWMSILGSRLWFSLDDWRARSLGAAVMQGLAYLPHALLMSGIACRMSEADLEDIARLSGSRWQVWRHAILPQSRWWLGAGATLVGLLSFTDITVTDLLRVRTFPEETYLQFQKNADPAAASALNLPLILVFLAIGWLMVRSSRHMGRLDLTGTAARARTLHVGGLPRALAVAGLAVLGLVYLAPIASLIHSVGSVSQFTSAYHATEAEFWYSIKLSLVAAVLATALAWGLAWLMVRSPRWRWPVAILSAAMLAVPAPLIGVQLATLFCRPGILGTVYDSPAILILAYLARITPFGVLVLVPAIHAVPDAYRDAARLEGANWLQQLWLVELPLTWRGVLVSGFLLFVLSLSELGASVLVVPAGTTTLAVRFATLIHSGIYPDVAGLCLMVIGGIVLPGLGICTLLWRWLEKRIV